MKVYEWDVSRGATPKRLFRENDCFIERLLEKQRKELCTEPTSKYGFTREGMFGYFKIKDQRGFHPDEEDLRQAAESGAWEGLIGLQCCYIAAREYVTVFAVLESVKGEGGRMRPETTEELIYKHPLFAPLATLLIGDGVQLGNIAANTVLQYFNAENIEELCEELKSLYKGLKRARGVF